MLKPGAKLKSKAEIGRAENRCCAVQRERWVCFACRKMFRPRYALAPAHDDATPPVCPDCCAGLRAVGRYFKPPRRLNIAQWRKAQTLLDNGVTFHGYQAKPPRRPTEVAAYLAENAVSTSEGARLLNAIAGPPPMSHDLPRPHPRTAGVYVHIPFCVKKCGYCDFNAYSGYKDATKTRYVAALCREIAARGEAQTRVPTIFFGGGTPTTLPAPQLLQILEAVRAAFTVDADAEVSVEANPSDADPAYLGALRAGGFNRLSFGVQTFDDRLLKTIDRVHSGDDARRAIACAKAAGFDNLSLDLMFGLPRQTVADWDRSLDAAFALDVPHLSMYGLIVEEGTAFFARRERGKLPLPSENSEAAMFGRAIERATGAGYERYEVSNYARPGFRSRHNQIYWRNEEYVGFGAGAASYLDGARLMNEKSPVRYAEQVERDGAAIASTEILTREEAMGETVMVGLRLADGVDTNAFRRRFGVTPAEAWPAVVADLRAMNLIETSPDRLRLTERGLFLASEVMMRFL